MSELKKKRQKTFHYDPEEARRLETDVFGNDEDGMDLLDGENKVSIISLKTTKENIKEEHVNSEDDRKFDSGESNSEESDNEDAKSESNTDSSECDFVEAEEDQAEEDDERAAWVDEDDKKYTLDNVPMGGKRKPNLENRPETYYKEYLDAKFSKLVGTPKWAEIKDKEDDDSDSDSEILRHSNHLAPVTNKKLRKGVIEIKALRNINKDTQNEGPWVTNLQFHKTSTVAFAAGLAGIVSVFQIDGKENTKLQSIKFDKFPINCARYLKDGTEIVLGTKYKNYFQIYDLMSGKTYQNLLPHTVTNAKKFEVSPDGKTIAVAGRRGEIHLLSGHTKELITTMQMNKKCNALTFTPDSKSLLTHGESEEIYIWDINSRRCIHRAVDDGCIAAGAMAMSPSAQFLATGSKQGVVNIYDTKTVTEKRYPQPLKAVMNLVTPISSLKFNSTSEILAMASMFKSNAFKMLHLPSFNVFSNFPTFQTVMHNPLDIDFSPNSGYLGISNDNQNAYLYRLKHYGNY